MFGCDEPKPLSAAMAGAIADSEVMPAKATAEALEMILFTFSILLVRPPANVAMRMIAMAR